MGSCTWTQNQYLHLHLTQGLYEYCMKWPVLCQSLWGRLESPNLDRRVQGPRGGATGCSKDSQPFWRKQGCCIFRTQHGATQCDQSNHNFNRKENLYFEFKVFSQYLPTDKNLSTLCYPKHNKSDTIKQNGETALKLRVGKNNVAHWKHYIP